VSVEQKLVDRTEELMNDFIGRLARAWRMSHAKPHGIFQNLRDEYLHNARKPKGEGYEDALAALGSFVRAAQTYREEANKRGRRGQWTAYEDQRLRKPIARLVRAVDEMRRAEAMRRLSLTQQGVQIPGGSGFGVTVTVTDVKEQPAFDTVVIAGPPPQHLHVTIDGINRRGVG
jgi:hypothetical protein